MEGTVVVTLARPDKMHRLEEMVMGGMVGGPTIERTMVLSGAKAWEDTQNRGGMGGGMRIMMAGPGQGPGGGTMTEEQLNEARVRRMRVQMNRLTAALLADAGTQWVDAGVAESPEGKADILETKEETGRTLRLFIDQNTKLPLMVQYQDPKPMVMINGGPGRGPGGPGGPPPPPGAPGGWAAAAADDAGRNAEAHGRDAPQSAAARHLRDAPLGLQEGGRHHAAAQDRDLPRRRAERGVDDREVQSERLRSRLISGKRNEDVRRNHRFRRRNHFGCGGGQVVQGTGVGSSLRVTVLDQTEAALIIAQVTIVDARGVEQTATVDERGVAVFENLAAGTYQVKASADSFRPLTTPFNVRRGENRTTLRLALATIEQTRGGGRYERGRPPRQRLHADAHAGSRSTRCPTIRTRWPRSSRAWPGRARRFS